MTTTIHTGEPTRLPVSTRPRTPISGLGRAGRWLLGAAVGLLGTTTAQAQLNYQVANALNTTSTYTSIAGTGTAITTANTDDANSAATPLGFTFNYNGTAFTDFVLNTNGFIRLGTAAPSVAGLFYTNAQNGTGGPINSTDPADVNLIMPFAVDLTAGTAGGTGYQVQTTGTSPNRICTIQWTNVQDKLKNAIQPQYLNFSFQTRLYENGQIDFVYGPTTPNTAANNNFRYIAVGIKGSTAAQSVTVTKGSTQVWSASTFAAGNYTGNAHNIRYTPAADLGRTYRFVPTFANDAAVTVLYTQGQLATVNPTHVVKAVVRATGSNATYTGTATLTVTRGGSTIFTDSKPVTSLAANANTTVTFAAYNAAAMTVGSNVVTVSVSADDNSSNDSQSLNQDVTDPATTATVNYASPGTATPGSLSFGATATGNVGSRFTTTATVQVNSIQAYIANGAGTVAGVLFNAAGTELGRSATRTLVAADAGTLITFTLTTPIVIGAGDFFAGVNLGGGASLGSQTEVPTRGGTFYQINATAPILSDLASANLGRFNLGAVLVTAPACSPVNGIAANTITTNSANITFNSPGSPTDFTVTYTPAGGSASTVFPNPTASPVALSGLASGTQYTVDITSNCGGTSSSVSSFTFTTLPTTDATVNAVYTLGQLPIPYATPHVVSASVKNNGTSAASIPVTLTVTGPSGFTFTDTQTTTATTAGANATVSFAGYTPTVAGTYTVTVTTGLPGDQLAGNNTKSETQTVNLTTFGYAPVGAVPAFSGGLTPAGGVAGTGSGILASKFTSTANRQITAVKAYLSSSAVGNTVYGVLLSSTGTILGRSNNLVATAAGLTTFTLQTPVTLAPGSFYVGLAQTANTTTGYFPLGVQEETPVRSGTFVIFPLAGGTPAASTLGRFIIEAVTATPPACGSVSGLTYSSRSNTSVGIAFTPPVGSTVTNYTATLTRTVGGTLVGTQTVTGSPVTFTGLTPNTGYTISIVTNCTSGGTSTATVATLSTLGDLVISTPTTISGTSNAYYNVTVTGTGVATLATGATLNVFGTLTLQPGSVYNTDVTTFTFGPGRLVALPGSTISVNNYRGIENNAATGDFNLTGGFDLGSDINIIYNNTGINAPAAAQVTGADAPAMVRSITVNSSVTGVNKIVALSNDLAVRQLVRLQSGDLDTDGSTLTLLSTRGVGTALIDNTGGIVKGTGTGIMQRAVDTSNPENIGYHHYSSPVSNTNIGDLAVPGIFTPVLNNASNYNTAANAGQVRPFPTVFGYNETRVGSTTVATDQAPFFQGYFAPANDTSAMVVGKGYSANVPNAAVVDFTVDLSTGSFNNGAINITGLTRGANAESGWQLLGNPYPSPLDWTSVTRTNVDAAMYIYHATSRYGGYFSTYLGAVPGNGGAVAGTPIIDAGSGFFARVSAPGTGSVSMSNANRVTTFAGQPAFGRQSNIGSVLALQVRGTGGSDVLTVYTNARATNGVDAEYDAAKLQNPSGLNLAALSGTTRMAIDGLPALTAATVIPLTLGAPAPGTYTLEVSRLANMGNMQPYLRDAVAGTVTPLVAGTQVRVTLTNVATATTRFSLVFRPSGALATAASLTASQVSLYPNPAHSQFTVLLPPVAGAKEVKATLLNALGQVVTTRTIALTAAGATAEFNTSALAQGVYMLRLTAGNETLTQRVVVE